MIHADPIVFEPCEDKTCRFFKQYTLKRDGQGRPYGIDHDGSAEALHLCVRCSRANKRDFFEDKDVKKNTAEEGTGK